MRALLFSCLALSLALAACGSDDGGATPGANAAGAGGSAGSSGAAGAGPTCVESQTDAIRLALAPTCESCHKATSGKPFFASLASFEALLAYNEAYVVRGKPEQSKLVALLEGTASGAFKQMPLGDKTFADLSNDGKTGVTIAQIKDWITTLPEPSAQSSKPDPAAASARRLRAEEFLKATQVALGYEKQTGGVPPLLGGSMQPLSPDSPKTIDYNDDSRREFYKMLGGASYMDGRAPEKTWSPSSLAITNQIALRECNRAVKDKNPVLFRHATPGDKLPEGEAAIQKNIGYLHLRFLGVPPSNDAVKALQEGVFAKAAPRGTDVAWVETCAALLRHPHFLTF